MPHSDTPQRSASASTRRHFLARTALAGAPATLAWLAGQAARAEPVKPDLGLRSFDLLAKPPSARPQATAMISMFMQGGPSQMDLMDPKPLLNRMHLQQFPGEIKYDNAAPNSCDLK